MDNKVDLNDLKEKIEKIIGEMSFKIDFEPLNIPERMYNIGSIDALRYVLKEIETMEKKFEIKYTEGFSLDDIDIEQVLFTENEHPILKYIKEFIKNDK